jgi:hypothetical protein
MRRQAPTLESGAFCQKMSQRVEVDAEPKKPAFKA